MFGAFSAAAPEITLLTLICVVLVVDLFLSDENREWIVWLSIASLAITGWTIFAVGPPLPAVIFDGSYVSDGLSQALKFVAILIEGEGLAPKAEPRPVVNVTRLQPPAIWPVTEAGS